MVLAVFRMVRDIVRDTVHLRRELDRRFPGVLVD
jgi:hypothetical protein